MLCDDVTLLLGDCRESMRAMPDCSVHCVVTSPPYWGLRDYGVAGQLGLEPTPEEYVAKMVEVFREVRRVLRDDGTCWVNLGDSYNGIGGPGKQNGGPIGPTAAIAIEGTKGRRISGLKPKDLVGIPWRVAFALQADGWWLRQDIIWHKPNPMPESVTDRCTKAHEYVFLLTKSARYFYDAEAVKEKGVSPEMSPEEYAKALRDTSEAWYARKNVGLRENGAKQDNNLTAGKCPPGGRNRRSVWTVATAPYKGSHFATFPPKLVEPCILAGCPVGGVVLDPFGGSGTTAGVAVAHGRKAILCELSSEYAQLIPDRVARVAAAIRGRKSQGREVGLRHD